MSLGIDMPATQAGREKSIGRHLLEDFDAKFYAATYSDIDPTVVDPLQHYVEFGFAEERFGSNKQLLASIDIVRESGCFDHRWYYETFGVETKAIENYLVNQTSPEWAPNSIFERTFFRKYYKDTLRKGEIPFVAFCRLKDKLWCRPCAAAFRGDIDTVLSSSLFNEAFFRKHCKNVGDEMNAALYYLTEGFRLGFDPSANFSTRGYMMLYPDIAETSFNPLLHYVKHGQEEGRFRLGDDQMRSRDGSIAYKSNKATLLILSHEASLSGAPIVGLNLARLLGEEYNVVCGLLRDGPLVDHFAASACELVVTGDSVAHMATSLESLTNRYAIDCALLNSVECTKMLPALIDKNIPSVSLIHEIAQYVYPFDQFARSIVLSDVAVFPSKLVESHARRELRAHGVPDTALAHVEIRPQGRPLVPLIRASRDDDAVISLRRLEREIACRSKSGTPFVVLGAGWVQPRKGVDLFIDVARQLVKEMGKHALFIWVGPNYQPKTDTLLSIYLADQITKSGLDEHIIFFDEQPDLQPFYKCADAFLLSSRLDPYPNVAVEAIAAGKHIICFEGATGIADLASFPNSVTAVPYNNVHAAAEKLASLSEAGKAKTVALPRELQELLSFEAYSSDVSGFVAKARRGVEDRRRSADALLTDDLFDPQLFAKSLPTWANYNAGLERSSSELAQLAVLLAQNSMPVALVRPDRSTAHVGPHSNWEAENIITTFSDKDASDVLAYTGHIAFAETIEDIERIADLIFSSPSLQSVMILSETLRPNDLFPVDRVRGKIDVSLVSSSDPALASRVSSYIGVFPPDCLVGVTFKMSAFENSREINAIRSACRASLDVEVYLLSAMLLTPDHTFIDEPPIGSSESIPHCRPSLAHRLVDCRMLWLRTTEGGTIRQTSLIDAVAKRSYDLRSGDVWRALTGSEGLLSENRWACIQPTPAATSH